MKRIFVLAAGCLLLFSCNNDKKDEKKPAETSDTMMSTTDKKPATELLDVSMGDPIKKSFAAFSKGDLDGMTADYDDNIRYQWSGGDTAIGKKAVRAYYEGRWKLISSLSYSNEIVLPLQVNESQAPKYAPTGKWVLYWAMVDVTYKNNKKLNLLLDEKELRWLELGEMQ